MSDFAATAPAQPGMKAVGGGTAFMPEVTASCDRSPADQFGSRPLAFAAAVMV